MATKKQAEEAKNKGNKFFEEADYTDALKWYTKAIELDSSNHVYYSNRSVTYLNMNHTFQALEDAEQCLALKSDWPKGYFRKGSVLLALKLYPEAVAVFEQGLKVDASDVTLKKKLEETKALAQSTPAAPRTPEQVRVTAAKEEGNFHFKDGRYVLAVQMYTRGLESVSSTEEKVNLLSNRAVSNAQLQMYKEVVNDCSKVLEFTGGNHVKCLLRRALAYESLEKLNDALADFRAAMTIDPSVKLASEGMLRVSKAIDRKNALDEKDKKR